MQLDPRVNIALAILQTTAQLVEATKGYPLNEEGAINTPFDGEIYETASDAFVAASTFLTAVLTSDPKESAIVLPQMKIAGM